MEWRDDAILLNVRRFGEADAILDVFARERGRASGLVRGGGSRRRAAELQPGAQLAVRWRGRLADQLGRFHVEATAMRAGRLLDDKIALAALSAVTAQLSAYFAEDDPHPALFDETADLLDALPDAVRWPALYGAWELSLLSELGFGLDLSRCAATGSPQDLIYVSPKSGRAVSRTAGAPYADKLLPLPAFLRLGGPADLSELAGAMRMTGRFLEDRAAPSLGLAATPDARGRLARLVVRAAT